MALCPLTDVVALTAAAVRGVNPFDGWLQSFDPEAHEGRGEIRVTRDIAKAQRFASFEAVIAEWKRPSITVPLRDDGKPNRPLTAYTVEPQKVAG